MKNLNLRKGLIQFFVWVFVLTTVIGQGSVSAAADMQDTPLFILSETKIGEGTHLRKYQKWNGGSVSKIYVTHIDLDNPYVKIAPIYGKEGKIAKQPLSKMADENGAVAAINANFFHLTQRPAPFAMVLKDGELISSQSHLKDWQVFGVTPDSTALIDGFGFQGEVVAVDGTRFPIFNLNKEIHSTHAADKESHGNRLNLYNSRWGGNSLGTLPGKTGVVEVVINNGYVVDIRIDQPGVPIPTNGYVLMGHGTAAEFLLNHVQLGDYLQISYSYSPDSIQLDQAIGAHALLVNNGQPVKVPSHVHINGSRARSGVGISHDGKEIFLVTVEASKESKGMTMDQFAQVFVELGAWKAANLDGGGSTTMVARMPADYNVSLINRPEGGGQRSIPDGIAVFNMAPPGRLAGIFLNGPTNLLVGSKAKYTIRGYDEHILPYDVYQRQDLIYWSSSQSHVGQFEEDHFIATGSGITDVIATVDGVANLLRVQVFGGRDIAKVEASPSILSVPLNVSSKFELKITTHSGQTFTALPENVTWRGVEGVEGEVDGFTYRSSDVSGVGALIGEIDGYTFSIPIYQGAVSVPFHSLEDLKGYSFSSNPGNLPGSFHPVDQNSGEPVFRGETSMKLTYSFTQNTEQDLIDPQKSIEIAYGRMQDVGLTFPRNALGLGAWVHGDNSNYWLRAELKDKNGKIHYVTLADKIDWSGWKYVEGSFPSSITSPVTLTSLYIVDLPDANQMYRPLTGSIYFDGLTALLPYDRNYVFEAKTVLPMIDQPSTDLLYSLPSFQLKVEAKEIGKFANQYTVTPIDLNKIDRPMPGFAPYGYGFQLDLQKYDPATAVNFPILIKPTQNEGVGLLNWSEQEGKWVEIQGAATGTGEWSFIINGDGLYVPFKKFGATPFLDIQDYWAKEAIARMYNQGIIQGMSPTEFRPNSPLTRGQFVTLFYRVLEKQQPAFVQELLKGESASFKDPIPEWAKTGVTTAVHLGVITGYNDQTFRADVGLNREQLAVIMERAIQKLNLTIPETNQIPQFADEKSIPEWAKGGAVLMAQLNLIPIKDNQFSPKQQVTRGEAAYAIAQLYDWMRK